MPGSRQGLRVQPGGAGGRRARPSQAATSHDVFVARVILHGGGNPWRCIRAHARAVPAVPVRHVGSAVRAEMSLIIWAPASSAGAARRPWWYPLKAGRRSGAPAAGTGRMQRAFDFGRHGRALGGWFAADVNDIGAIPDHLQAVGDGSFRIGEPAAIGKRVRRGVEDAHDQRPAVEAQYPAAAAPDKRVGWNWEPEIFLIRHVRFRPLCLSAMTCIFPSAVRIRARLYAGAVPVASAAGIGGGVSAAAGVAGVAGEAAAGGGGGVSIRPSLIKSLTSCSSRVSRSSRVWAIKSSLSRCFCRMAVASSKAARRRRLTSMSMRRAVSSLKNPGAQTSRPKNRSSLLRNLG